MWGTKLNVGSWTFFWAQTEKEKMPRQKKALFTHKKNKTRKCVDSRLSALPDSCTPKIKELYRLAVQASKYVVEKNKPERRETPSYKYIEAKDYLDDLKTFSDGYEASPETKKQKSETFLDETLYLACQLMGITFFEIGKSWESIDEIRNDIEFRLR